MFWVLLTLSLACADKLDRTYLPPPGSQYAGGRPENIQVPFEYYESSYPANPDNILNREIAIGIDRKGPKEIQEGINFSDKSSQQSKDFASKILPPNNEYLTRSSISSDNKPKYTSSERPDIGKFQSGQNEDEYIISNEPEKYLSNNRIYPQQTPNREFYTNTLKPKTNNMYVSTSMSNDKNPVDVDLDDLISLPCNKSSTNNFNRGPCIGNSNSNQYLSTLNPTSTITTTLTPATKITNFSERSSIKPQNNEDITSASYYSTTKNPLISFNIKRPERIQAKSDREAVILNYENVLTPEGYAYSFDTSNGIHGDENAVTLNGVRAKGSYSYIGDDGKLYRVIYTADENGFRPEGDHLPTPPPIPDAILKVIEKAYKDKKAGIFDDGSYDENKYGHKKYQKDFNNLYPYMQKQKQMKLNYMNLNTTDNIFLEPNQHNAYLKTPEQNDNNSNKQVSGQTYSTTLNNFKNSTIPSPDDYEEIDNDDAGDGGYQKPNNTKPTYKHFDIKYNQNTSFTNKDVKNNERTISSPTIESSIFNQSGYFNYPSQNEKEFPTRFSEISNDEDQEKNRKDTQVSPKPFMTPYVLRNEDDELQNYDSKEKLNDEPRYHSDDKIHQDYINENYLVDGPNTREESDTTTSLLEDDKFKSTHDGYFYPKAVNSYVVSNKQFSDPNVSQATYKPFEFSTRSSIIPDEGKYYSSPTEKDFSLLTTVSLTEASMEYLTSTIPTYSSKTYENAYEETNEPTYYKNGVLSTEKNIEISIPKFGPSYSPNINIMNSDTFNFPSSIEKVLGEDFSGPKRPQSFDPLTGYQY